jgi:hypothetical protein
MACLILITHCHFQSYMPKFTISPTNSIVDLQELDRRTNGMSHVKNSLSFPKLYAKIHYMYKLPYIYIYIYIYIFIFSTNITALPMIIFRDCGRLILVEKNIFD